MLKSAIVRNCVLLYPSAWPVTIVGAVSAAASAIYAVGHFAITTNIENLILPELNWHGLPKRSRRHFLGSIFSPWSKPQHRSLSSARLSSWRSTLPRATT
jgi:hypothetical protein